MTNDGDAAIRLRTYIRSECAVFKKTNEAYGGLSNMASGYSICIDDVLILSSEALYQACRFPDNSELQRKIIEQASPMTAKMVSKPFRNVSRSDWMQVRVKVMRWALRVKLAQNFDIFSELLRSTAQKSIVEESNKDSFWGARAVGEQQLVGENVLGRLLMELRVLVVDEPVSRLKRVPVLDLQNFRLMDKEIGEVNFEMKQKYFAGSSLF